MAEPPVRATLVLTYRPLGRDVAASVADAALARELAAAGCTFLEATEAAVASQPAGIRSDVYATSGADAYLAVARSPAIRVEVQAQSVLTDGTAVATSRFPPDANRAHIAPILEGAPEGYDLVIRENDPTIAALLADHAERLAAVCAARGCRPIDHRDVTAYVALRNKLGQHRADRLLSKMGR